MAPRHSPDAPAGAPARYPDPALALFPSLDRRAQGRSGGCRDLRSSLELGLRASLEFHSCSPLEVGSLSPMEDVAQQVHMAQQDRMAQQEDRRAQQEASSPPPPSVVSPRLGIRKAFQATVALEIAGAD